MFTYNYECVVIFASFVASCSAFFLLMLLIFLCSAPSSSLLASSSSSLPSQAFVHLALLTNFLPARGKARRDDGEGVRESESEREIKKECRSGRASERVEERDCCIAIIITNVAQ